MPRHERVELTYLQSLSEAELRELVLLPLLTRMGYRDVRSVHGALEFGKDIVFSQQDPLAHERHYAVVVKRGPLTGSVSGSNSLRAALYQVEQSFGIPFLDPRNGKEIRIDGVYLITSAPLTQQAIHSCQDALAKYGKTVSLLDGQALADLIRRYQPDFTWSLPKDLPLPEERKDEAEKPRTVAAKTPKTAFVLMPFGAHYDLYYGAIFKPGLEAAGYLVHRADDISTPQPIIKDIQDSIVRAELILCDMSSRNPNVFYELGLAHAIGKPVILLADNLVDVPFDLRHIRVIVYDCKIPDWASRLRDSIRASADAVSPNDVWPPPLKA